MVHSVRIELEPSSRSIVVGSVSLRRIANVVVVMANTDTNHAPPRRRTRILVPVANQLHNHHESLDHGETNCDHLAGLSSLGTRTRTQVVLQRISEYSSTVDGTFHSHCYRPGLQVKHRYGMTRLFILYILCDGMGLYLQSTDVYGSTGTYRDCQFGSTFRCGSRIYR
jgi:hypothetical protein